MWRQPYVAGVSLTYDGSLPEHLDEVVPALDDAGIKGTFFAYPPEAVSRLSDWRKAAATGHEIGNGFLYGAVSRGGLAPSWPHETYLQELEEAEDLISDLNPLQSLAMPCVETEFGSSGIPAVSDMLIQSTVRFNEESLSMFWPRYRVVRSPLDGFNDPATVDLQRVRCFSADRLDANSLSVITHIGISQGAWTVWVFSPLADSIFDPREHRRFVQWLSDRRQSIEIDCFGQIAMRIREPANVEN